MLMSQILEVFNRFKGYWMIMWAAVILFYVPLDVLFNHRGFITRRACRREIERILGSKTDRYIPPWELRMDCQLLRIVNNRSYLYRNVWRYASLLSKNTNRSIAWRKMAKLRARRKTPLKKAPRTCALSQPNDRDSWTSSSLDSCFGQPDIRVGFKVTYFQGNKCHNKAHQVVQLAIVYQTKLYGYWNVTYIMECIGNES